MKKLILLFLSGVLLGGCYTQLEVVKTDKPPQYTKTYYYDSNIILNPYWRVYPYRYPYRYRAYTFTPYRVYTPYKYSRPSSKVTSPSQVIRNTSTRSSQVRSTTRNTRNRSTGNRTRGNGRN